MGDFGFDSRMILDNQNEQQRQALERQRLNIAQQQAAQEQQMNQLKMGQMQYDQQRQRNLTDLVSQNAGGFSDPYAQAFAQGGYWDQANAAQNAAVQRQQMANQLLSIHTDLTRSRLSAAKTPDQIDAVLGSMSPDVHGMYGLPANSKEDGANEKIQGFINSAITPEQREQNRLKEQDLAKGQWHTVADPVYGGFIETNGTTGQQRRVAPGAGQAGPTVQQPGPQNEPAAPQDVPAPLGSKLGESKEKMLKELGTDLDRTQGRSNLAKEIQEQIRAGQRMDTLLNRPGPMTAQRLHEATLMAATIANGGHVPNEPEVEAMFPKTLRGKAADFWQSVANIPMDADAKLFVDQLKGQSESETKLGEKQINEILLSRLVKHPDAFKYFPEKASRMAEGAGLKGLYDPKTLLPIPGAHRDDAAALTWAKANPKDPRAADILKANGAQ